MGLALQGAIRKRQLLTEWAAACARPHAGEAGYLEPNELVNETDSQGNLQELIT